MAKQSKKSATKKPGAKGGGRKPAATSRPTPAEIEAALTDAALRLAAAVGWRQVSLREIAADAGVPLSAALPVAASKTALLRGFVRRIDREALAAAEIGDGDSPRDRLFEVMMARFDALRPHREGVAAVLKDSACAPLTSLCLLPSTLGSLELMLAAAGIPTDGARGTLRIKGLGLVYADAMRAFLRDSSEDLAATMARVDAGLKRAERVAARLRWDHDAGPDAARA